MYPSKEVSLNQYISLRQGSDVESYSEVYSWLSGMTLISGSAY